MRYLIVWYSQSNVLHYSTTIYPAAVVGLVVGMGGILVNITHKE